MFAEGHYPTGEEVEYRDENSFRTTSEEKRYLDRMNEDFLAEYRQGAEVHRQVRQWAQRNIKPGQTLTEIAEGIEDGVRALTGHQGLNEGDNIKGGMGFPTGLSINHCAAHYTPNAGNKTVLQKEDVMKVDFGVHLNGRIVDSAFTMTFDPVYDNLLAAVKDATNTGVRVSCREKALPKAAECVIGGRHRRSDERHRCGRPGSHGELRSRNLWEGSSSKMHPKSQRARYHPVFDTWGQKRAYCQRQGSDEDGGG